MTDFMASAVVGLAFSTLLWGHNLRYTKVVAWSCLVQLPTQLVVWGLVAAHMHDAGLQLVPLGGLFWTAYVAASLWFFLFLGLRGFRKAYEKPGDDFIPQKVWGIFAAAALVLPLAAQTATWIPGSTLGYVSSLLLWVLTGLMWFVGLVDACGVESRGYRWD